MIKLIKKIVNPSVQVGVLYLIITMCTLGICNVSYKLGKDEVEI